jgi:hypothetical protein
MVFTVNKPALARFINFFYPRVSIITNVPQLMMPLKKARKQS